MTGDLTIVCCVESGPLEVQTVRLVESLRRWGGGLGEAPVLAVTPRIGPRLLRSTREAFDRLRVDHLRSSSRERYLWQHYMNKPLAIAAAAEHASTEQLVWFDSDMLVVRPPTELVLDPDEDFVACARDKGIGSTGPGDPRDGYWRHACEVVGLALDDLPWVVTHEERSTIRLYWNSGLFAFRRRSAFPEDYLRVNLELLDARVGTVTNKVQFNDQVALGLAMVRTGLRWRPLGHEYNVGVSRWHTFDRALVEKARIVHYHDSLAPDFFPQLVGQIAQARPDVAAWLDPLGPLRRSVSGRSGARHALRLVRGIQRRRFYRECRWV